MNYAQCHPDRKHQARGLCDACYQDKYRVDVKGGKARQRRYKLMPDMEPDWMRVIPHRTAGVRQNAVTSFPIPACPHCGSQVALVYHGREARCAGTLGGCGHTVYLVREGEAEEPKRMGGGPRVGAGEYLHA